MTRLSPHEDTPLYLRCRDDLARRLERGEFGHDEALPSEGALCDTYGVSRITVRRAMAELARAGMILRRRGSGTFPARPQAARKSLSLVGPLAGAMSHAEGVTHRLLGRRSVTMPATLAAAFEIAREQVTRLTVVYSRGLPFCCTEIFVPHRIAGLLDAPVLADPSSSIFHLVEDKSGTAVAHADQALVAVAAPPAVASALGLRRRSAVLCALRAFFSRDGTLLQSAVIHYHPERFHIAIRFIR